MADSTAKGEAMQAIRLLYVAAHGGGSSDHKNPETLYRARRLLEELIEGSHTLEPAPDDEDMTYSDRTNTDEWYTFSCDGLMVTLRRENRK